MKIFFRLLRYVKPYHHFVPEYLIFTVLGILFGLLNFTLLIPMLNLLFNTITLPTKIVPTFHFSVQGLQDTFSYYFHYTVFTKGKMTALMMVCSIIFFGVLMSNVFKYLSARVMSRIKIKLLKNLRNELFAKLMEQDLAFHYQHKKGQNISVLMNDIQDLDGVLGNTIQNFLRAPLVITFYVAVLFYLSVPLTLFTILFFPFTGLLISSTIKKLKKKGHFSQEFLGKMLAVAEESLSGIKIIKSFHAHQIVVEQFKKINAKFSMISRSMFNQREIASPLSEFLGVSVMVVLVLYGGHLILQGDTHLTGAVFITYLAIYSQMLPPLKDLSAAFGNIQKAIVCGERIFAIIDKPILIQDAQKCIEKNDFVHSIEFKNVKFKYQDEWVLNDFSCRIQKGQTVAFVGKSGSGKTTLVDLLYRFYDIQEGEILIDGINIKNLSQQNLHALIGIVTQEPFLFNDNIANNIAFGSTKNDIEKIQDVAKIAFAEQFIEQLEHRYYTNVGERGMKLSGGQRQRITIARALYKAPPILVLDEATASLDSESEKYVQNALENATKKRTSIIIAHRLSTIKNADQIFVIEKGKLLESGTHDELLAHGKAYSELIKMQEL